MTDHYDSGTSVAAELQGSGVGNLYGVIDRLNVHGLNLVVPEDARTLIKPWHERDETSHHVDSNVDDQLVIHIPFIENVRVRSILLKLGRGETTPRQLRIYSNHINIVDFSDAETLSPQLNISLLEGETAVQEYPLRAAAFLNINSLSLHFGDSAGGEISRLYYIGFKGETRSPRKEGGFKLKIPAANAADAPIVDRISERNKSRQSTAR